MGFFTSVKNAGLKTKLKGEITLLDREIVGRQQLLGTDLYDLLEAANKNKPFKAPAIFHTNESQIKGPFDACKNDIRLLIAEKDAKEQELVRIEANRDRARPSRTNAEMFQKAGTWVSDSGTEAKLQMEIKLVDRQMRQRKEKFGVDVFEELSKIESAAATVKKASPSGVKAGIASRLSKLSGTEQEIQKCLEVAKRDLALMQSRKATKEREICRLDEASAAS